MPRLRRDHVLTGDARIEKLEIRTMQARAVIGVVTVLDQQLPVARRIHLLAACDDLETVLGLVGHEVQELRGAGQVFLQRNGLRVVVDEIEVAVCLEPRHARQIVAAIGIESFRIAALRALVTELAGLRIVNPAMVRTGKHARVARRLPAHRRTAVCTGVEVRLRLARTIATEDHVVAADRARDEIARTRDLRTVTHVQPAAPEYESRARAGKPRDRCTRADRRETVAAAGPSVRNRRSGHRRRDAQTSCAAWFASDRGTVLSACRGKRRCLRRDRRSSPPCRTFPPRVAPVPRASCRTTSRPVS